MIVTDPPQIESAPWTSILLPKPKPVTPEPQPRAAPQPTSAQPTETVDTLTPVPPISDSVVAKGPVVLDPLPLPPGPAVEIERPDRKGAGAGTGGAGSVDPGGRRIIKN